MYALHALNAHALYLYYIMYPYNVSLCILSIMSISSKLMHHIRLKLYVCTVSIVICVCITCIKTSCISSCYVNMAVYDRIACIILLCYIYYSSGIILYFISVSTCIVVHWIFCMYYSIFLCYMMCIIILFKS
jgi:hypothetical protein